MIELGYNDGDGTNRLYFIDPESTSVVAGAKQGRKAIDGHAEVEAARRERDAAKRVLDDAGHSARRAAVQAGKDEKPLKKGEIRKAAAAAREAHEDAELDWLTAVSKMQSRARKYLEVVEHHTPAVRAEALEKLDSQILSLASVVSSARRTQDAMSSTLQLLGALAEPGDFRPRELRAEHREFGDGGSAPAYVGTGLEQ